MTIIDDDNPGVLDFHEREIHVQESAGDVGVRVVRTGGSKGKVSCTYRTVDGTAIAGADYKSSTGTLVFGESGRRRCSHTSHLTPPTTTTPHPTPHLTPHPTHPAGDHETSKDVPLTIYNDDQYEKEEFLKVVLEDVSGGATFAAGPNGEEVSSCTCQVGHRRLEPSPPSAAPPRPPAPPHPPHPPYPTCPPHPPRLGGHHQRRLDVEARRRRHQVARQDRDQPGPAHARLVVVEGAAPPGVRRRRGVGRR